jgi:hypothetical protein
MNASDYVKSLMAKLPKAGEKVVKMTDTAEQAEVISLREKLAKQTDDLTSLREEIKSEREAVRLDKCKAKVEDLIKAGKAFPTEKEFALELAKSNQALFDKWAATHTKKLLDLNKEHGSSEGDEQDLAGDPQEQLMSLVGKTQKANNLSFTAAWDQVCRDNPRMYDAYRKSMLGIPESASADA